MNDRNAIKVGIASFLMLVVLALLLIWKSGVFYRLDGYQIVGEFPSVNGLVNGADVRYRGSKVGKVFVIEPTPKAVLVYFRVESNIQIPKNSVVKIYFDGLIGEKFLNIIPNATETEMLKDGDHMAGTTSAGLAEFVEVGAQNLEATKAVLQAYQKLLVSPDVMNSFANTIKSVEQISRDLAILSHALAGEGANGGALPKMLSNLTETTGLVKKNTELLFQDGQLVGSSKDTVRNLALLTAQLQSVVHVMSTELVTSANLKKINSTLDNVQDLSAGLRGLAGTEVSYGPVGALQKISKVKMVGAGEIVPITTLADQSSYEGYVDSSWGNGFIRTGIAGVKSSPKPVINIQYGHRLAESASARVGYFQSYAGLGVDYQPIPKAKVSVEVFNVDEPQVALRGKYAVAKDVGVVVNLNKNPKTSDYDNFGVGISFGPVGAME